MAPPHRGVKEERAITQGGVAYVLRTFPEPSETFIHREIRGLLREGVPVSVLAMEPVAGAEFGDLMDPGASPLRVHYLNRKGGNRGGGPAAVHPNWRWFRALVRDLLHLYLHPRRCARCVRIAIRARRARKHLSPDTLRLHGHFANDAGALARYLSILTGLPYSLTAHAYDIYQDPFLLAPNLAGADRVFTVSRANVDHLSSRYDRTGRLRERLSLLRCGIDLEAFPYEDPRPVRDPARILCVARLIPKKGHQGLLEAVASLIADGLEIDLALAGEGPLEKRLRRQVDRLGIQRSVQFLGTVPPIRVRELLEESDLMVLAARVAPDGDRDGLPVALVESAALGIPVVSTEVSGIPELVTPETGWITRPDRGDLLAETIRDALTASREERTVRARRARAVVEEEFDLRRQIRILRSL